MVLFTLLGVIALIQRERKKVNNTHSGQEENAEQSDVPPVRKVDETNTVCAMSSSTDDVPQSTVCAPSSSTNDVPQSTVCAASSCTDDVPQTVVCAASSCSDDVPQSTVCAASSCTDDVPQTTVCAASSCTDDVPHTTVCAASSCCDNVPHSTVCAPSSCTNDVPQSTVCAASSCTDDVPQTTVCAASSCTDDDNSARLSDDVFCTNDVPQSTVCAASSCSDDVPQCAACALLDCKDDSLQASVRFVADLSVHETLDCRSMSPNSRRYEIRGHLGEGGFGTVYADGYSEPLPLEVALQILANKGPRVQEIIQLLDWQVEPDYYFMVLERPMPCLSLYEYLKCYKGTMEEDVARVIMHQAIFTYCPPEYYMTGKYHGEPATVWSLGILMFVMRLTPGPKMTCRKNFIRCCLQIDPKQRIELEKLHEWFVVNTKSF
uniref:non-specific serine/threonine protein kinase n=1 Tax=Sinocyclocheilus rhinocerous TaxID=307959 RepID=A0A673MPN8_9TELE